ncbi:MAG: hypothetical protein ACREOG_07135 [Gemmatimonadaceae bacterium]
MHDYTVYGGWLRSAIPIPELRPMTTVPSEDPAAALWQFELATSSAPELANGIPTGRDELTEGVFAQFIRAPNVARLAFDDTGTFDIVEQGRRIVWYPKDGSHPDVVRADLIGRVLPLSLHERGLTALHASAVVLGTRAIAFVAPKNHGKSTLAMGLVERHQARLLSDDTLIVSPATGLAEPGVHSIRLWEQTARRFSHLQGGRLVLSEKRIFEELPDEWLADRAVPLAAIYTISPEPADVVEAARRERLDGAGAAIAMIQYQKLGALLGGLDAARVFEYAADLASRVPVYTLHIARDLDRLGEVTETLVNWHVA